MSTSGTKRKIEKPDDDAPKSKESKQHQSPISDKWKVLNTILIIAERELRDLSEYDAKKLNVVLEVVTDESPGFRPDEIFESAVKSLDESLFVKASILLRCSSALYHQVASSSEAIVKIEECISTANDVILKMLREDAGKFKQIAISTCLPIMQETFEDLKKIEGAEGDEKTKLVAWCYYYLGYSNRELERYTEAYNFSIKSIQELESGFASDTSRCGKFKVLAYSLHQLGLIMWKTKDYPKAENYFERAIEEWKKVEDRDEHEDHGMIETLKKLQEKCKKKIRKQS